MLLAVVVQAACLATFRADGNASTYEKVSPAEIATLIDQLSHASYATRTDATHRLCEIGPQAEAALRTAASGDNAESALRAKQLLAVLERVLFSGVQVSLKLSKSIVRWDEQIDLRVTMTNHSQYAARIPFVRSESQRLALSPDARQVGDMQDVAEWLQVRDALGQAIELHVDNYSPQSKVAEAINSRIHSPPVELIEPGEKVQINIEAINRGWARYRLLDQGTFRFQIDYEPAWSDEFLRSKRVGRMVSNEITADVTSSAPEAVSRRGVEARLTIQRNDNRLVAKITNQLDRQVGINRNLGHSTPFAKAAWVYTLGEKLYRVPAGATDSPEFSSKEVIAVESGKDVELASITVPELLERLHKVGANVSDTGWKVHFSYSNLLNQAWLSRARSRNAGKDSSPSLRDATLPALMLTTRHVSNQLVAPSAD